MKNRFTADFETTTTAPAAVWLWGIMSINNTKNFYHGLSVSSFLGQCMKLKNPIVYMHNLKFDGHFILYYLLKHGYTWRQTREECRGRDFLALIGGGGDFYCIEIYFKRENKKKPCKCMLWNSLNLIPLPLREMPKTFDLPHIYKESIDYDRHNTPCDVTEEEVHYIYIDCKILALSINKMLELGLDRMTIGGCALNDFKKFIGRARFNDLFPQLTIEEDSKIRTAYKGGFMFMNPIYIDQSIPGGIVLDRNGLYSYILGCAPLPYDYPVEFEGKYVYNDEYPLFIQFLKCQFELKPGKLPTVQARFSEVFDRNEFLESSEIDGVFQMVQLSLTSLDLELFFEHYNVYNIEYNGGIMFKASNNIFKKWVTKWQTLKEKAGRENNPGLRYIAKRIPNSVYGKFGTNPICHNLKPEIDEEKDKVILSRIEYDMTDENGDFVINPETGEVQTADFHLIESVYIPIAVFVTAWGRYETIKRAQQCHEENGEVSRFIYSDTDSIHLAGFKPPAGFELDQEKTGAWKLESAFSRGKYLGGKKYFHEDFVFTDDMHIMRNGYTDIILKDHVVFSGMPRGLHKNLTFETFDFGTYCGDVLRPRIVTGGVILKKSRFIIKNTRG